MVKAAVARRVTADVSRGAVKDHVKDAARNRQNEYFAHGWLRLGGIGERAANLTQRERPRVRDLHLTTYSNELCVQSNIFGFVMR